MSIEISEVTGYGDVNGFKEMERYVACRQRLGIPTEGDGIIPSKDPAVSDITIRINQRGDICHTHESLGDSF